jgi:hypothetical protein
VILHCNYEELQALRAGGRSFLQSDGAVPARVPPPASRACVEAMVVATHAADEDAVAAYFDFAHVLSVSHRLDRLVDEMEALVELLTGEPADDGTALTVRFPDE